MRRSIHPADPIRSPKEHSPTADEALARLWSYLSTWVAPGGGVHGPVIHRGDLKRTIAIHDTAWTQGPIIEGLVNLYQLSGCDAWLARAVELADAQCARLQQDGSYRWAGHEDDRFSSLVHNALANCALLRVAEVLDREDEAVRRERYLAAVERNIEMYWMKDLYSERLRGFRMNPVDYYSGTDRFVANMNSVAAEALIRTDRLRGRSQYQAIVREIGEKILSLQAQSGPMRGAFSYSDAQPDIFVTLYTALTLRGLRYVHAETNDPAYARAAALALVHLEGMEDPDTGLWWHEWLDGKLHRYPIFVAGAGMICSGIVAAAKLAGHAVDRHALASRLLEHQLSNGAFPNFAGYDHPDNARPRGRGLPCWEDVFPSPNWNAQAFLFLTQVVAPPQLQPAPTFRSTYRISTRFAYGEWRKVAFVLAWWPPRMAFAGFFFKRLRYAPVLEFRRIEWWLRAMIRKLLR